MLYTINRKQFFSNVLTPSCGWTDLIRDSENFSCKFYFDETDVYYSVVNYGMGETITVFSPYSDVVLEKAKNNFPGAAGFSFSFEIEDSDEACIKQSQGSTFLYKLYKAAECDTEITIQRINENTTDVLKAYDDMYLSFLRENHGARLLNCWKNNEAAFLNGDERIYTAWKDGTLIGFVNMYYYGNRSVCDISQITIEEPFRNHGYGKQLLWLVVRELQSENCDIYYSSVNGDNIASRKTAESVGFKPVSCRVHIPL